MPQTDHDPRCEGLPNYSPDELRARKLAALDVGDIFGAAISGGNTLPFLVVRADEATLQVRAMTSQFRLAFNRSEGEAVEIDHGVQRVWRVVSMQPLPLEHHQLMLSLDRRMRLGSNGTTSPLDEGDLRALLYLPEHWAAYPI